MENNYESVSVDWEGKLYYGITLEWNCYHQIVDLSILNYVPQALKKCLHVKPKIPENQPHNHNITTYGAKVKYADPEDC